MDVGGDQKPISRLAERAGIMAGMASAKIEHNADGRTRLVLWTDTTTSADRVADDTI